MDKQQLLDLYEQEERIRAEYPHRRREVTPWGVRHVPLDTAVGMRGGFVSYSRLNEQNADQAIEEQIAYCESLGVSFEWKAFLSRHTRRSVRPAGGSWLRDRRR